jgi:inhibitor of the pro-sigma K processing machinery
MKMGLTAVFVLSVGALLLILVRSRSSFSWLKRLGLQLVAAALLLYFLDYSGVISGFHVPVNPIMIATVIMLGVPGIFLILGLEWMLP